MTRSIAIQFTHTSTDKIVLGAKVLIVDSTDFYAFNRGKTRKRLPLTPSQQPKKGTREPHPIP